jgi:hypothetical protein
MKICLSIVPDLGTAQSQLSSVPAYSYILLSFLVKEMSESDIEINPLVEPWPYFFPLPKYYPAYLAQFLLCNIHLAFAFFVRLSNI